MPSTHVRGRESRRSLARTTSRCRTARAMAKPLDLALEDHLLRARLDYVKTLKEALADPESEVSLALEVYTSIIDGVPVLGWAGGPCSYPSHPGKARPPAWTPCPDAQGWNGPSHPRFAELIDEIAADVADRMATGLVRPGRGRRGGRGVPGTTPPLSSRGGRACPSI